MRYSLVSLGVAASVQILPAAAHDVTTLPHMPTIAPISTAGHHQHSTAPTNWQTPTPSFHAVISNQALVTNQPVVTANHNSWSADRSVQIVLNPSHFAMAGSNATGVTLNLDLSSSKANISADTVLTNGNIQITVGGKSMSVNANTLLTPGEYLAAMQVAAGGPQTLTLNARGIATGGSVEINQTLDQAVSSLVIPQGVTVVDMTRTGSLNVTGNLTDDGSLYVGSLNPAASAVNLIAGNIKIDQQGLISDVLPVNNTASSVANLAGNDLALNIASYNSVVNTGTIYSGGSINLNTASGNITNSGLIASKSGSINIDTNSPDTNINITGSSGTFQALTGNINVRNSSYTGTGNINLTGGNYLSQNLNLNSGAGSVTGSVGNISGTLNTAAQVAHIDANSTVLTLGSQQIKGDPTYANTGDIDVAGPIVISGGADLAIVAGGNILSTSPNASITDNGGNVLLIAGALITSGGTGGTSIAGTNPAGAASGTVTVSLTGGAGGNIDFAGLTAGSTASTATTVINTSNSEGSGGNVTLVALANGAAGGSVYFNNSVGLGTIDTRGSGGGSGSVAIYGGANSGTAIQTNSLLTGGSTSTRGGDVFLSASQAQTSDGNSLSISSSGSLSSFNKIIAGTTLMNGNVTTGSIDTSMPGTTGGSGGAVSISTAGGITVGGAINTTGSDAASGSGGNGGAVTVTAGTGISLGNVTTIGGVSNGQDPISNMGLAGANGGPIVLSSTSGNIFVGNLATAGGGGTPEPSSYFGGNGGQGGLIAVSALNGSVIVSGSISSLGGNGGTAGIANGGNAGLGGAIVIIAGGDIDASAGGVITSSGGIGGGGAIIQGDYGNIPTGIGGSAGSISLTAGSSITTNSTSSIVAEGGSAGIASGEAGAGGQVMLTAGTGNISAGNIASDGGAYAHPGIAGNILIVSVDGDVTVGNTGAPSGLAAINASGNVAGSVTVSAVGAINLVSVDGNNNVINASSSTYGSSVLLASAMSSGVAISLDGGNIATSGSSRTGDAWVLSLTGSSHGNYSLNGASNINDYLLPATLSITNGSGTYTIGFVSGSAPTNFSPGGYGTIDTTTQQIVVNTGTDTTLIVPLVSTTALGAGAFNISGGASLGANSYNYLGLYGNSGINANLISTSSDYGIYLAGIVDTSSKGISISSTASSILLLAAATTGTLSATETPTGSISIVNTVTAAEITLTTSKLGLDYTGQTALIAQNGNIVVQSTGSLYINGLASFTTGNTGSVLLLANGTGNTLTVATDSNLVTATPNFVLQSPNIILGDSTYSVFSTEPIDPATLSNTMAGGNLIIENPTGSLNLSAYVDLSTAVSGTTSLLAMASSTSGLTITDNSRIKVSGGGEVDIRTPNLIFQATNVAPSITATSSSLISIDGGDSSSIVPVTIITPAGFAPTIATNGGTILIHSTGDLVLANGGIGTTTLNLNAGGTIGAGLVDVQGLGNVTLDSNVSLITNSPIQINLNANQTLTLAANSILETTFSGNAAFPDPLGGTFQYSILVQNLITNFNVAGTGTILQGGSAPGNTVFNDFIDVGFAAGSNITFQSLNPGSFVNFFTRQIQVNGTVLDSTPTATLIADSNVTAININTNLPSPGPGNIAFQPGTLATTASLDIEGAPLNVGFSASVPPISIPSVQQPVGNINFGLSGGFSLTSNQAIAMYGAGTIIVYSGSSITSTAGNVTLATTDGSSGSIILGGIIAASGTALLQTDGYGAILSAGGSVTAPTVHFVSSGGTIGAPGAGNGINTFADTITAVTGGSGSVYINQTGAVSIGTSQSGNNGIFSLTANGDITTTSTISGQNISLTSTGIDSDVIVGSGSTLSATNLLSLTSSPSGSVSVQASGTAGGASVLVSSGKVVNDGTIESGSVIGDGTIISNSSGALTISGTGSWIDPTALTLSASGNLNAGSLFSSAQLVSTNALSITATNGVLILATNDLSAAQDALGNGGSISITSASLSLATPSSPLTLSADATGSGNGGTVIANLTGTPTVTVGTAAGNLTISAEGGSAGGNGGTAIVKSGGNLVVNPAQINVSPLSAGGTGGNIVLQSDSKTAFSIGASSTSNGTKGALSVAGDGGTNGTLSVTNLGSGGVTLVQNLSAVSQVTLATSGNLPGSGANGSITINGNLGGAATTTITLIASGSGKITSASKSSISSANIIATSGSGAIQLPNLVALQPITLSANIGDKATISVANNGADSLTLINSSAGTIIAKSDTVLDIGGPVTGAAITLENTAKTGGSVTIDSSVTSTGTITLTTPGQITIDPTGSLDATKSVTLTNTGSSATSTIAIDGSINTGSAGTVIVKAATSTASDAITSTGADISAGKSVTITATKSSIVLDTIGQTQAPATVSISSLANIQNNGAMTALDSVTETTTATTGSSQILIDGLLQVTSASGKVILTNSGAAAGAGINAAAAINAGASIALTANKGDISVVSLNAGTTVIAKAFDQFTEASGSNITGVKGVSITTTSSTGTNHGSITLDNIETGNPTVAGTAGGAITVTAAGGTLAVDSLAVISANSAKTTKAAITLENKLITGANTGLINIGSGAQITTAGTFGGNVNIVMGAVPSAPKGNNLPTITGVNFNPDGTQSVIFVGAAAINHGINFTNVGADNLINVSAIGSGVKVILNTGNLPDSAITINGGTTNQATVITADPPTAIVSGGIATLTPSDKGENNTATSTGASSFLQSSTISSQSVSVQGQSPLINQPNNSNLSEGIINASAVQANTRTLYGAAVQDECIEPSYVVRPVADAGDIEATVLTELDLNHIGEENNSSAMYAGSYAVSDLAGNDTILHHGNALILSAKGANLKTEFGTIKTIPNAMVLIMSSKDGTAIYNLDDNCKGSVSLTIGKETINLTPGAHIMVTSHSVKSFESANPAPAVSHRNLSNRKIDTDWQIFTSEFSTIDAMTKIKPIRSLISSRHPQVKRAMAHMLKTSAILSQLNGPGQYQKYVSPELTRTALLYKY